MWLVVGFAAGYLAAVVKGVVEEIIAARREARRKVDATRARASYRANYERDYPAAAAAYQEATGYTTPPCPACGEVGEQDWADVTQVGDDTMQVLPGLRWCRHKGCPREGEGY